MAYRDPQPFRDGAGEGGEKRLSCRRPSTGFHGWIGSLFLAGCAVLASWVPSPAHSQTDQTWINGSSNWDLTTPSWDAGAVWTQGNNAIFGGAAETVTLGAAVNVNNITFNSSGFVIQDPLSAGSLSLAGPSTVSVTTAGHTAAIDAAIIAGALTKAGAGTLLLGGNNTFAGNVLVNAGALRITHASALGSTAGTTTVDNNARLELSGGLTISGETITINGNGGNNFGALQSVSGANEWAGNILIGSNASRIGAVGAGSTLTVSGVIDDGANTYTLAIRNADSGGVTILSGANTYKGSTDVVVGVLKLHGGSNRLPTGTTLQIGNGGNVATATIDLNGVNQQVAGLVSLGTTMARTATNSSATASTLTISSTTTSVYAGVVAGNLHLVKAGSGIQTLSGDNTYSGTTTVSGGTLEIGRNNGLGSTTGGTVVNSGAQLVLANGVTVTGETITIAGNGGNNNGALQTAVNGTATWAGDIILSGSSRVGGGAGGTLIVNGTISGVGGVLFSRGDNATTILNAVSTYTGDTQMFANAGTRATLRMGVDNAISPLSQYSTISANATRPMDLDLNGHVLTLRALDTSVNHANGANMFILNHGATPSVFTISGASGSTNFTGIFADGTGGLSLVKDGASTQVLVGPSTYTGSTTVKAGILQIGGPVSTYGVNGALASTQYHLMGGTLALDNLGASNNNANRLADAAILSFEGGSFLFKGSAQAATNSSETVGTLDFVRKISVVTTRFGGTNVAEVTVGQLTRSAGGGLGFVNGVNLGRDDTSTASVARLFVTTPPLLVGTTDALSTGINASVQNTKIVPFLLGSATTSSGGLGTDATTPNTFVTYNATTGLRPLNPTDEFSTTVTSGDNVRVTATGSQTVSSTSINSLIIDGNGVDLNVGSGQTLTVASGAILVLGGADNRIDSPGTLAFGSQEGLVTINSSGNTWITASITGTAGMTYHGSGTLVLGSQQNTYSGDTVLRVANVIPQSSSQGPAGAPTSGPFGTGALILDGSAIRATTGGDITIGNELILRADTAIPNAGVDSKNLFFTGPATLEGGDRTIIHNSPADTIFSGNIGDGGQDFGLTVAGTGTGSVVLGGTNTYTGATTVSAGTLLVNGNSSGATGNVTVDAGATLGGNGTIGGNATIYGTLSAGSNASVGTVGSLAFNGKNLTFNDNSTWLVDIVQGGTPSSDAVTGVNDLNIGNNVNLALSFTDTFQLGNAYLIAAYSGAWNGGLFTVGMSTWADNTEMDLGVGLYRINYSGSGGVVLTAVPEPAALLPMAMLLIAGLLPRRRRRVAGGAG